jgi:hypothetical protein
MVFAIAAGASAANANTKQTTRTKKLMREGMLPARRRRK